jgi:hypothetical protein
VGSVSAEALVEQVAEQLPLRVHAADALGPGPAVVVELGGAEQGR